MAFERELVVYKTFRVWLVFGACLEVMWRCEQRTLYIGSVRVKLILACQEVLKWL